jgi:hypothetical protein
MGPHVGPVGADQNDVMDMARTDLALQELSGLLWRERQLLDRLEYTLVIEQLVLESGQVRWLARASEEVANVLDAIRIAELSRAVVFVGLAAELGMAELPPLRTLMEKLPPPWSDIFVAHRRALTAVIAEVHRLAEETRALLAADSELVAAALADLDVRWDEDYDDVTLEADHQPAQLAFDLVAHQVTTRCAMAVSVEVLHPTLAEFLA